MIHFCAYESWQVMHMLSMWLSTNEFTSFMSGHDTVQSFYTEDLSSYGTSWLYPLWVSLFDLPMWRKYMANRIQENQGHKMRLGWSQQFILYHWLSVGGIKEWISMQEEGTLTCNRSYFSCSQTIFWPQKVISLVFQHFLWILTWKHMAAGQYLSLPLPIQNQFKPKWCANKVTLLDVDCSILPSPWTLS